jgi:hypothetical protein
MIVCTLKNAGYYDLENQWYLAFSKTFNGTLGLSSIKPTTMASLE